MSKGKLFLKIEEELGWNQSSSVMRIGDLLDEAKKEFLETTIETHSLEDHYDNIFIWYIKWFGDENE